MSKFLPSLPQVSREVIATGIAVVLVAWIVASNPRLRSLVRNYEL